MRRGRIIGRERGPAGGRRKNGAGLGTEYAAWSMEQALISEQSNNKTVIRSRVIK